MKPCILTLLLSPLFAVMLGAQTAEVKDPAISGGVADGKVRLVIEGLLDGARGDRDKLIFATALQHTIKVTRDQVVYQIAATFDVLQGEAKELPLTISGEGEIRQVTGELLQDWSIRQEPGGGRTLILRPKKGDKPLAQLAVAITVEHKLSEGTVALAAFTLTPAQPSLASGFVKVEAVPELEVKADAPGGLFPIEPKYLPEPMRGQLPPGESEPLAFQFQGAAYSLPLRIAVADPETRKVVLRDYQLTGRFTGDNAVFVLSATARVTNPKGGTLALISGAVALTDVTAHPDYRVTFDGGLYQLTFDKPGDFPLRCQFHTAVRRANGWNAVEFRIAPATLQSVILQGLPADTQFDFAGGARPERRGEDFASFLQAGAPVKLAWKSTAPETEGKLFYAAEMLAQISVAPGLMRQVALLDGKVMQGELDRVAVLLRGTGEVTRVIGEQVLAWKVEDGPERRLVVQFNQPQKNHFALQVQTQTPIGAFPQTVEAMQLRPEGATRFAGYFRIVNEGAVRLEVAQARGLSQVSPEQFPESGATKAAFRAGGEQRFAYRFSGADFLLRVQADQILPELTVSQVLAYHLGETELGIDAEIEVDVREAPLRELILRVPRGFAVAKLNAAGLADYFLRDLEDPSESELRLVYAQPVSGRQIVLVRLERNQALGAADWTLPRIEVEKAKSVRGHVAVSADTGFRLTAQRTQALTEIATAFFPRKIAGIQSAFRLSEMAWQATLRVERLPQSIQVDAFHLFSIGEGVAYGSSVLNYAVSGAPVAAFKVELSPEYFNVEFTGKDIRNWQKIDGGFLVQLHTPVSGAYTLLATYERPFKAQGETLAFTGARPLDAQAEQGNTIVISAYQFQVKPVDVSAGLLPLETGEVPAEYRLFFDAPILAAYRYAARPFNLRLALSPLAQGDSLSQVVDRAALTTRISKEGQVLTDARYFVKSRGHAHFRLALPEGTELWSATVNGAPVVPVKDASANLVPLPQQSDSNAVLTIDLKLAARSKTPTRVQVAAPVINAPVMLAEWKVLPDTSQQLVFRRGSLTPEGGVPDRSGFATLARTFGGRDGAEAAGLTLATLALLTLGVIAWRDAGRDGVFKYGARYWTGLIVGCAALAIAGVAAARFASLAEDHGATLVRELAFLAPVQQAGAALSVEVANEEQGASVSDWLGYIWPVLFALAAWAGAWFTRRSWLAIAGWTLLVWAALRAPEGSDAFVGVIVLFVAWHFVVPALRRLWTAPRAPKPSTPPPLATTAAVLLVFLLPDVSAQAWPKQPPIAASVAQEVRVEGKFAFAAAKVRWQAVKGQRLPLLYEPAVLTGADFPIAALKLVQASVGDRPAQHLLALEGGVFDIEVRYQVPVTKKESENGFALPVQFGLINQLALTLVNLDVDVVSPQAISTERKAVGKDTLATLVLPPTNQIWIGWKPRSRDLAREKAVFYGELTQLYAPTAGLIEGLHHAAIRPAQGELGEVVFNVPKGATITDVLDPVSLVAAKDKAPAPSVISQWRFDPDTGKLRVSLSPAQSRPFALLVRSQVATGPMPVTQTIGLLALENAAGQIGLLGFGTGSEVQLDTVEAGALSAINLEDFPTSVAPVLAAQIPGLAVRRAYRYADPAATTTLKASAVEPDVRVESQDTLSLGEDRVVLAVNATVAITRAGIFRLSFALPTGMDVESIAGEALSHWTEAKTDLGRIITLHLRGRTDGQQQFAVSLAGPGLKSAKAWVAPQLVFREATKQRGTVVVVPEQGMRLQVASREGVTQLDPQKSGLKQKGVLAFRVLQTPWNLALDVEQVDAWVQVTSLQHAMVGEAQVKVGANLQYQIENTGMKAFRVALPANAESVRFAGDQVADFLVVPIAAADGMQMWEAKLHRRVIGPYFLHVSYQTPVAANAVETTLRGLQAADVNLQRGFVTVQAGGRLQVRVEAPPAALQPTEWQSIPRALQQDLAASSASFAYRLVEPAFVLALKIERHEAAKLLPARVNNVTFTSVISDNGAMLTQARLEILPGDKRLLHLTLPKDAKFWFAFVNRHAVWPWREADQILIPLEQQARGGAAIPVEVFYSTQLGGAAARALDLALVAPKFDLPLENITWQVWLDEKWKLKKWTGSLQLQSEQVVARPAVVDGKAYLQSEASQQRDKTKAAEQMLALGNTALAQGDPQQARRAFENAWSLSQHDAAFNEDARVQLHNLKLQQALVGLNVRNSATVAEPEALANKLRGRKDANYTQQDAKQLIDQNSADENAALTRLAERLLQQQDAAVTAPTGITANVPTQGRLLTFSRAVAVDQWADLQIHLRASAKETASWFARFALLAATAGAFLGAMRMARPRGS